MSHAALVPAGAGSNTMNGDAASVLRRTTRPSFTSAARRSPVPRSRQTNGSTSTQSRAPAPRPSRPGKEILPSSVTEIVASALKGGVRAMYMMGENPFLSDPNVNKVRKALAALEFLVVQDIFLTETSEFADALIANL